jgi:hypothetical protein
LKADVKYDIILFLETAGNASSDWDDGHKIDEGGAILSIVDNTRLALLVVDEVLLHVGDSFGGIMSSFSLSKASTGCLEKAAVTTEDLMLFVACETIKRRGGINYGGVISPYVGYDKGAGQVNGAEGDARIGSSCDTT